jgi:putative phosphoribosyl transferase
MLCWFISLVTPSKSSSRSAAIDDSGNAILTDYAAQVDPEYLESEKQRQLGALRQRRARYTPLRPPIDLQTRIVIVVDDGVATGSTMVAALRAVRAGTPRSSSRRWQWLRPMPRRR